MGCPNQILSVALNSPASGDGFMYKYDLANNKLVVYQGDSDGVADGPAVAVTAAPDSTSLSLEVTGW
jgi:hypothetical protein